MGPRIGIAKRGIAEERPDPGLERTTPERRYPTIRSAVVFEVLVAARNPCGLRCGKKRDRRINAVPLEAHAIAEEIRVLVHRVDTSRDPAAESLTCIERHTPVVDRAALQHELTDGIPAGLL